MFTRVISVILLGMLLAACAGVELPIDETQAPAGSDLVETVTLAPIPTQTPTETATPTTVLPTSTLHPSATPTPSVYGPTNFPSGINPLTGLPVENLSLLDRRPMAIKVQLYPRGGRPPWGVSQADIVFDYFQNDGLTRLNAIFYGNDAELVGPIRSARLFDDQILSMYKTIFAFGGGAEKVRNRLWSSEYTDYLVVEGNKNCPPMCRIEPNGPNYLVTNTQDLSSYISQRGLENGRHDLNGMSFDPRAPEGGQPGSQISTRYSISAYNRWDYDPVTGRYLRFQDTKEDETGTGEVYAPLLDRQTNEQIAADTLVVIPLIHQADPYTKNVYEISLSSSGPAYAFRDGKAYKVLWNRPNKDALLYLTFEDGTPFPFKPGTTWYQVIGQSSKVETTEDGSWRFTFMMP
jgi:hypothetical protein